MLTAKLDEDCELNNTEMAGVSGDETDLEPELGCDEVEVIIGDS